MPRTRARTRPRESRFHSASWSRYSRRASIGVASTIGVIALSTRLASPTIGTSTATFLPISAGSMSTWMIRAYGA